jgi:predicted nucleotidyltransferase component of viral defense system
MIRHDEIRDLVVEWGIREDVIEKDYAIGWFLWGIGSEPALKDKWIFKGGTCLKKCFLETYRFSEDLDFTVLPGGPLRPDELKPIIGNVLTRVSDESGIDFTVSLPRLREREGGLSAEGRIYYRGPRGAPMPASIKLDLSGTEKVVRPVVIRPIAHPFSDELPPPGEIRCYSVEELLAEKIRALGERCRPRDLYDVVNLYRRDDFQADPRVVVSILREKCRLRGIPVPTFGRIETSEARPELFSEWENMLGHQLQYLPPIESFWEEIRAVFEWLETAAPRPVLPTVTAQVEEDTTWSAPPTVHAWRIGVPLESIRFAAVNRLCVELGYHGSKRVIEPYSLRRTHAGNLILYAIRRDNRELRCYRVDRIESVSVTGTPYKPVYAVEFSGTGLILTLAMKTSIPSIRTRYSRRKSGTTYIIECLYCGRRFKRKTRNTTLRPHKNKKGRPCYGRLGYIVDTRWR